MFKQASRLMGVVVVVGMACGQALAQDDAKAPWEEYDKLIGKRSTIAALGPTLLGDQVDLVSGALSFRHADVELPGNDALPVAVARTFQVDVRTDVPYHDLPFADWDLDVPRLSGSFASDWPDARCAVPSVEAAAPPTVQVGDKYFYAPYYWHGLRADMPGGGEMLVLGQDGARPASGGPYYWTTAGRTVFACLGALKNGSGQGFLATTADGTRYWFDWMAQYHEPSLKGTVKSGATHYLARRTNVLYATRIEDRHGNWVTYDYANAWNAPARLTAIASGDGRRMTLAYNGSGQIQSVSVGTRTWSYAYSGSGVDKHLSSVTLPDGSQWRFDLAALSNALIRYEKGQAGDPVRACGDPGGVISGGFSGSVTHPSGAVGTFAVQPWRHGRSNVPRVCNEYTTPSNDPNDDVAVYPWAYDAFSLVNKTLSGPGVAPLQWQYDYTAQISFAPGTGPVCTSGNCAAPTCLSDDCAGTAVTTVTAPSGEWTRYTHGNSYRYNEGKLLKVERGAASADRDRQRWRRQPDRQHLRLQQAPAAGQREPAAERRCAVVAGLWLRRQRRAVRHHLSERALRRLCAQRAGAADPGRSLRNGAALLPKWWHAAVRLRQRAGARHDPERPSTSGPRGGWRRRAGQQLRLRCVRQRGAHRRRPRRRAHAHDGVRHPGASDQDLLQRLRRRRRDALQLRRAGQRAQRQAVGQEGTQLLVRRQ
nr:hypothetical protein [Xanthomonas axonopodis]